MYEDDGEVSDLDELIDEALAYAEQLLSSGDEFIPFGHEMSLDGDIDGVLIQVEEEVDADAYRTLLHQHLGQRLRDGLILGYTVCCDTTVGESEEAAVDAVIVEAEHVEETPLIVLVPYAVGDDGDVAFGEPYVEEGRAGEGDADE